MKLKIFVAVLLIIFVLWYTNPAKSQYENYMLKRQMPDTWSSETLKQISDIIHNFSVRQNYILFSVFDYKAVDQKYGGAHIRYIGVFNQIFNLSYERIPGH